MCSDFVYKQKMNLSLLVSFVLYDYNKTSNYGVVRLLYRYLYNYQ